MISESENYRKWQLSRRRLLQLMGSAGAAAMAAPLVPSILGRVSADASSGSTESTARRTRQWAMVIDLRKCEGCVVKCGPDGEPVPPHCIEGCNAEHFVPPGQEWIKVFEMEGPGGHNFFLPRPCMHCENPPCVKVCPVGATYKTEEGVVLVNHDRCIGCRMCMAACPYGVRQFNWDQPPNPPGAALASYSPEYPVPHRKGTVEKCMLCAHLAKDGKLPACAEACPLFAIYLGDLAEDIATNGDEVVKLSRFLADNDAFRLKEELGTRPRVWYIPGHGQESGHTVDMEHRRVRKARDWQELEATVEDTLEHERTD